MPKKIIFLVYFFLLSLECLAEGNEVQQEKFNYTSEALKDPFESVLPAETAKPMSQAAAAGKEIILPDFNVQGVIWGAIPLAIIDDTVVKVGDKIQEAEVKDIKKNKIELFFQGKIFSIPTTYISKGETKINYKQNKGEGK